MFCFLFTGVKICFHYQQSECQEEAKSFGIKDFYLVKENKFVGYIMPYSSKYSWKSSLILLQLLYYEDMFICASIFVMLYKCMGQNMLLKWALNILKKSKNRCTCMNKHRVFFFFSSMWHELFVLTLLILNFLLFSTQLIHFLG